LAFNLTDEELRSRVFKLYGRPDGDPELVTTRPSLDPLPVLIHSYDLTPPNTTNRLNEAPMVWCSICQKVNHWKGWVCESADGAARFLVGDVCAKRRLGAENHGNLVNVYEALANRSAALKRQAELLPLLPAAQATLDGLALHPTIQSLAQWRCGFKDEFTTLANALDRASRSQSPALLKQERVRDVAAEVREQARTGVDGPPRYTIQQVREVSLPFAEAFSPSFDPLKNVSIWSRWFARASNQLSTPGGLEGVGTETIEKAIREVVGFAKDAVELTSKLDRARAAFNRNHWKSIVHWANRELPLGGTLLLRGKALVLDQGIRQIMLDLPSFSKVPDVSALEKLIAGRALEEAA
jgi:hypothetical protein